MPLSLSLHCVSHLNVPSAKCHHADVLLINSPASWAWLARNCNVQTTQSPCISLDIFSISPSLAFPTLKRIDSKLETSPSFFIFIPGSAFITRLDGGPWLGTSTPDQEEGPL